MNPAPVAAPANLTAGASPAAGAVQRGGRAGALPLALQEVFTVTMRLRGNRQVAADAAAFRQHVKQLLSAAHEEGRRAGYAAGDVRLAMYALVVFLDESVLESQHEAFVGWPRKPLQEELFGGHTGGEQFFHNIRALLTRSDSEDLADVLEIYQLCLLLGFQGRYAGAVDELRRWMAAIAEKIARIRGPAAQLSPDGLIPADETIPVHRDPWLRRLLYGAVGGVVGALVLLLFQWILLQGWVGALRELP